MEIGNDDFRIRYQVVLFSAAAFGGGILFLLQPYNKYSNL